MGSNFRHDVYLSCLHTDAVVLLVALFFSDANSWK